MSEARITSQTADNIALIYRNERDEARADVRRAVAALDEVRRHAAAWCVEASKGHRCVPVDAALALSADLTSRYGSTDSAATAAFREGTPMIETNAPPPDQPAPPTTPAPEPGTEEEKE